MFPQVQSLWISSKQGATMIYLAILGLTILDVGLTTIGLSGNFITEGNPLLAKQMTNEPIVTSLLILLLTIVILFVLYRVRNKTKLVAYGLGFALLVRTMVVALHANWIVQVLSQKDKKGMFRYYEFLAAIEWGPDPCRPSGLEYN